MWKKKDEELGFFFQAEDGIREIGVTGVQTCALPISYSPPSPPADLIILEDQLKNEESPCSHDDNISGKFQDGGYGQS